MHAQLGNYPDITLHKCDYIAYSDCALFGNYLMGNEIFGEQLKFMSQFVLTEYACDLPYVELVRAKNQYFNKLLLENQSAKTQSTSIARQVLYHGRRVSATEEAYRVAAIERGQLQRTVTNLFWDKDLTITAWGPVGHMMGGSIYRRDTQRSTLGLYGSAAYFVM